MTAPKRWGRPIAALCAWALCWAGASPAWGRAAPADGIRPEPEEAHRAVTAPLGAEGGAIDWTARSLRAKVCSANAIGAYVPPKTMPYAQRRAESLARDALTLLARAMVIGPAAAGAPGAQRLADALSARPELMPVLDACVHNMQVLTSRYGADGSVALEVALPLDGEQPGLGALWAALRPVQGTALPLPDRAKGAPSATGIVINARGTGFVPSLWPRIIDGAGTVLYGPEHVPLDVLVLRGLMGAAKSLQTALHDGRVGQMAVVFNAQQTAPQDPYTLVLGDDDARALRALRPLTQEARVVAVVD
jgi:hypothetical protein